MEKSTIKTILTVLAVLLFVAGIAFVVYKYFFADKDEEFLDDIDDAFLDIDEEVDDDDPFDDMVLED